MSPAAWRSRAFHTTVPEPVRSPWCQPLSIGPTLSEIAGMFTVEAGGRALAGLLDRVAGELQGDAAGRGDAVAHALGEFEMMAVAGRQVGPGLRDADDRLLGGELLLRQAVIEVALEIERRHAGVVRVVEPQARAELIGRDALLVGHVV